MRSLLFIVLKLVGTVALLLSGGLVSQCSFDQVRQMRELERVPRTEALAVLPGEVNLEGRVAFLDQRLRSPDTNSECVYYRYHVEREERDSEGRRRWRTVTDDRRYAEFALVDASGQVRVTPSGRVSFNVDRDHRRRAGRYRYTEYRLDPGDVVFVFGYAVGDGRDLRVDFDRPGAYTPIISQRGELGARRGMATWSLVGCWVGLLLLASGVALLCTLLRVHQVVIYIGVVTVVLGGGLFYTGLRMMAADLRGADARVESMQGSAADAVRAELEAHGIDWDGDWGALRDLEADGGEALPEREGRRVERIRIDLARAIERTNDHIRSFPDRIVASALGIRPQPPLPLTEADRARLAELEAGFVEARVSAAFGVPIALGAMLLAWLLARFGVRRVKEKRCIENLPTSRTSGVAFGLAEVKGRVQLPDGAEPLSGPVSHRPCVHYHYEVKERRGSGKNKSWVTIESRRRGIRFLCRDRDGVLPVDPDGAEVITTTRATRRQGRRMYIERRLEVPELLYALGTAEIEPTDHASLVLRKGPEDDPFILSNLSEGEVMLRKARIGLWLLNFSVAAAALPFLLLFGMTGSFAATDYLAAAMVPPFYLAGLVVLLMYNDLVFLRLRVRRAWSNIDVSLKKRADLLPNIEALVKRYLAHEKEVQEAVSAMRQGYGRGVPLTPETAVGLLVAEQMLSTRLIGLQEEHPEMKGDELVGRLSQTLVELENDIALMREGYNQSVERFNTRAGQLPEALIARAFGFEEEAYFRVDLEVRAMPPVTLSKPSEPRPDAEASTRPSAS